MLEHRRGHPLDMARAAMGSADEQDGSSKPLVLFVDDEKSILRSLRRLLIREPYELLLAESGKEALEIIAARPVKLIISDQRMPGMTGLELLEAVRDIRPDALRIILSGYTQVDTIIEAINRGEIYKYLTKPWNDEELKLHIKRALEQHDLRHENTRLTEEVTRQNDRLRELNKLLEERADDAFSGLTTAQELFESMSVGLLIVDGDGLVVSANRHATQISGICPGEFLSTKRTVQLPPELLETLSQPAETTVLHEGMQYEQNDGVRWRVSDLREGAGLRGRIVTLWKETA